MLIPELYRSKKAKKTMDFIRILLKTIKKEEVTTLQP